MTGHRIYPSKVLLVGEYSVLMGHSALAIPWEGRYAKWAEGLADMDTTLLGFLLFLQNRDDLRQYFKLDEFELFIKKGGYLKTDIPYGYGLGSSGSFCAAVLDRFSDMDTTDIRLVHFLLKTMESFFHGQSSGLDPLVSFYQQCIQIQSADIIFPEIKYKELFHTHGLSLIDSKIKRDTFHLVQAFKESLNLVAYRTKIENDLVPLNTLLIEAILENRKDTVHQNWINLSELSLDLFRNMIPDSFYEFWKSGLESQTYYCKLCGAGGGGLFLTKIKDTNFFEEQLLKYDFESL